jgi:hypothetical protein
MMLASEVLLMDPANDRRFKRFAVESGLPLGALGPFAAQASIANPKKRTRGSVRRLIFAHVARGGKTLASHEVVDLNQASGSLANFDDRVIIVLWFDFSAAGSAFRRALRTKIRHAFREIYSRRLGDLPKAQTQCFARASCPPRFAVTQW